MTEASTDTPCAAPVAATPDLNTAAALDALAVRRDVVALVRRQPMRPVAGHGTPVFPATYAADKNDKSSEPGGRYCISPVGLDGTRNVCVIDSVQSQAGRIEATLQQAPYRTLTREVGVSVPTNGGGTTRIDMLAAGHRVFDAVFRYSTLVPQVVAASRAYTSGDARLMAELAPLALICGAWDSRGEKLQIPRAFSAEITAHDVSVLSRGAVYKVPVRASEIEGLEDAGSAEGLESALSFGLGGVIATRIERRAVLSLATLRRNARAVRGANTPDDVLRYLWALALVVSTMPVEPDLRSGCLLVPDGAATLVLVRDDGTEEAVTLDAAAVLAYAQAAAQAFGIADLAPLHGTFDAKLVKGATDAKAEGKKTGKAGGRTAKSTGAKADAASDAVPAEDTP
jgi:CRISPR-associated protein Csb1